MPKLSEVVPGELPLCRKQLSLLQITTSRIEHAKEMEHKTIAKPDTRHGVGAGAGAAASHHGTLPMEPELSVMRVNQLDAGVLDTELHGLLKTQLGRACSGLPAGTLERFKPEVTAVHGYGRAVVGDIMRAVPSMHIIGAGKHASAYGVVMTRRFAGI